MSHPLPALIGLTIPPDLARQLRIRQYRLADGSPADLVHHPDAARLAAELRRNILPTTFAIVRKWLNDLTAGPQLPKDGNTLDVRAGAVFAACSEFPASVWSADTLARAFRTFKWFPSPAEVYDLLKPEANKIADVIAGLEAVASAPPAEIARPAAEPYVPPPPPEWVGDRTIRTGGRGRGRVLNIQPPLRSVAEQLALLRNAG
jgi:hypothetical protein